jgi:transcriptional regulator with XRE-family HTH domain
MNTKEAEGGKGPTEKTMLVNAARLKKLRGDSGFTQEDMVEKLKGLIEVRTYQNIEGTGRCRPSVLDRIAVVLNISVDQLLAEGQQPWRLPSRKWDPTIDPPGALLLAEMQVVRFHYRDKELDDFTNWCKTPQWFGVRTVVGSGGMGKTRFALEICRNMLEQGWRGGFFDYATLSLSDETWSRLLDAPQPLLLVFDYAENNVEAVESVLTRIAKHNPKKVRTLLLARNAGRPGDWWDQLRMKRLAGDLVKGPAQELVRLKPVTLTPEDRGESHRQAQEAFAKILKKSLSSSPSRTTLTESYFDRVLLLHMHALALVEGSEIKGGDEILDYVLDRERRYWCEVLAQRKFAETIIGIEEFEQAMAVATFVGGINEEADANEFLRVLPSWERLSSDEVARKVHALSPLLHDCYGADKWIDPVQPDLLGQRLFDRAFHSDKRLMDKIFALVHKMARK